MRRLLLAAAVLPLLLAACGGSKHSSSGSTTAQLAPTAYVKQAAAKTARAESEHAKLDGTVTLQGQTVTMTGEGDFDNAKHQGTMEVHAKVAGVDIQIDEVLDGTSIYLRSPLLAAAIPNGKTWMNESGDVISYAATAVERFTPMDADTIDYKVTITDPVVMTRPYTLGFEMRRQQGEILEVACHEDNQDLEHLKHVKEEAKKNGTLK